FPWRPGADCRLRSGVTDSEQQPSRTEWGSGTNYLYRKVTSRKPQEEMSNSSIHLSGGLQRRAAPGSGSAEELGGVDPGEHLLQLDNLGAVPQVEPGRDHEREGPRLRRRHLSAPPGDPGRAVDDRVEPTGGGVLERHLRDE